MITSSVVTTVYVKKEEEKVYNALLLEALTVEELKIQVRRYSVAAYTCHGTDSRYPKSMMCQLK